jgi:acetyl-CoA carboxylase carboxyltransferase component
MTARERLAALFQEGTFREIGMHIRSLRQVGVAHQKELPANGVVVGTGYVDGRAVAACSQDFTVAAGTLGKMHATVLLSGVVPQIAVVCGPCAGGAAYSPALMDFIIMTRSHADLFITGPEVIKAVTGKTVTMDEVGGADMQASVSGNVHFWPMTTPRRSNLCAAC